MSKILPDFILADLFPSSLVLIDQQKNIENNQNMATEMVALTQNTIDEQAELIQTIQKPAPKPSPEKWFLGNNGKQITVLVNENDAVYLTEKSLQFLTKIIGACKLNMGDIAVVNIKNNPVNFEFIKTELAPKTCILFDVKAKAISIPFVVPDYQIQQYGGCTFLMAPAISAIDGDTNEAKLAKTKLWVSLKSIFNL
jgi:hypothetical protein